MKSLFVAIAISVTGLLFSQQVYSQPQQDIDLIGQLENRMAALYTKTAPSVVRIIVCPHNMTKEDGTCPVDALYNNRIATGFIVHPDGYIVSTAEVASQPGSLIVMTADDWQYNAQLVAVDERLDISLIKIDKRGLPALTLGSASSVRPGHMVMSVSNPYGLTNSMSWGIINGRYRTGLRPGCVENYLQTTLPMNPGDSGSPLINTHGEVIGIMVAALVEDLPFQRQAMHGLQAQGISFALPVDLIKKHIPYMIKHGQAKHSWLGLEIKNITQNDFERLQIIDADSIEGIVITRVFPDSPSAEAGLQEDDIVQAVNDMNITTVNDMQFVIATIPVDSNVQMSIIRNNTPISITVTTKELPTTILNKQ